MICRNQILMSGGTNKMSFKSFLHELKELFKEQLYLLNNITITFLLYSIHDYGYTSNYVLSRATLELFFIF